MLTMKKAIKWRTEDTRRLTLNRDRCHRGWSRFFWTAYRVMVIAYARPEIDMDETHVGSKPRKKNPGDMVERLMLIAIPKDGNPEPDQS